jgi:hypothetical protein
MRDQSQEIRTQTELTKLKEEEAKRQKTNAVFNTETGIGA